ncbi:MAG: hypothetical protein OH319_01735 [Candidatus Parvarchaeota archaeon]|nr:hypothetical protein [Candidatus Jingweiarchaeum tengchongense]MCW1298090.1 hypothetical protein [Candidatus Jingweiarchaeum tengchongense]MCW1300794.1 hypothetical protein [Candidatus Jingweiarchaeum tengchongense]MCW1310330.1 hypothetical protein [Candidatus Jingweiarchaeum tengchongense]
MEHLNILERARSEMKIADHMMYVTVPLLSEKMLMSSVIEHMYKAMVNSMLALLEYERYYKKIFSLPSDDKLVVDLFFERHGDELEKAQIAKDLKEFFGLYQTMKKSQIELKKDNELVIISDTFESIRIDEAKLKSYCEAMKKLLKIVEGEIVAR